MEINFVSEMGRAREVKVVTKCLAIFANRFGTSKCESCPKATKYHQWRNDRFRNRRVCKKVPNFALS